MASELGLDVVTAKRAGLLHDLGKAIDHDVEGPHAVIGAELARRYGEKPVIVHAIELTMPTSTPTRCSMSWCRPPMPSLPLAPVPVASLLRTTSSVLRSSRRSPTPMTASSVPMPCRLVARSTSWFSRTRSPMPVHGSGSRYRPSDRGRDGVSRSGARRRDSREPRCRYR